MSSSLWTYGTVAHQALLSMGSLQARILEWVAVPSSMGSSWPRDRTHNLYKNNKFPAEVLWLENCDPDFICMLSVVLKVFFKLFTKSQVLWLENCDPDFICMLSVVLKVFFKLFTKSHLQGSCSFRCYRVVMSKKGKPRSSG